MVAEHQAGAGAKELSRRFGVHRGTVCDILRREGALGAPGVQLDDVPGVSLTWVAEGDRASTIGRVSVLWAVLASLGKRTVSAVFGFRRGLAFEAALAGQS